MFNLLLDLVRAVVGAVAGFVYRAIANVFSALVMLVRWPKVGLLWLSGEVFRLGGLAGLGWSLYRLEKLSVDHWAGFVGSAKVQVIAAGVASVLAWAAGHWLYRIGEVLVEDAHDRQDRQKLVEAIRSVDLAHTDSDALGRRR